MTPVGRLLDAKRFSIHDGPGIRTTLFFKGCVLKCLWCHNPESISPEPQLGFYWQKCISCGECAEICAEKVHIFNGSSHHLEHKNCTFCGQCERSCPGKALKIYGRNVTVEEAVNIALADKVFYQKSGGGVTLSGGEPLLQINFAEALLKALKAADLHTAVDSCACVKTGAFERVLPFTDIFLIDFKHADSAEHRKLTGQGNEQIKENLQWLSRQGSTIEIRIPVVPGCNDSAENMHQTADFLGTLDLEAVRLLPYHSLARGKYRALNMPDTMPETAPPEEKKLAAFAGILQKEGLQVKY